MALAMVTQPFGRGLSNAWSDFGGWPAQRDAHFRVADVGQGLRGAVATRSLARGDHLLSVPLRSILAVARGPNDDAELARLLLRAVRDDDRWRSYRDAVLPLSSSAAMLWDASEIEELQHEDAVTSAAALADRVSDFLGSCADSERDDALWAIGTVYSRSFELQEEGGEPIAAADRSAAGTGEDGEQPRLRALVPLCDLFNHEPESPVAYAARWNEWEGSGRDEPPSPWRIEPAREPAREGGEREGRGEGGGSGDGLASMAVTIRSPYDLARGDEVRLPYGLETNAELLLLHGFVLEDNAAECVRGPLRTKRARAPTLPRHCRLAPRTTHARRPKGRHSALERSARGRYVRLFVDLTELVATISMGCGWSEAQQRTRLERLASLDAAEAPLAVRPGPLVASGHLLGCLALAAADDDELDQFDERYREALGHHSLLLPAALAPQRQDEVTAAALRFARDAAAALRRSLPSTLEEDAACLAGLERRREASALSTADERMEAAVRYRLLVKRALRGFVDAVREAEESDSPAVRRKLCWGEEVV